MSMEMCRCPAQRVRMCRDWTIYSTSARRTRKCIIGIRVVILESRDRHGYSALPLHQRFCVLFCMEKIFHRYTLAAGQDILVHGFLRNTLLCDASTRESAMLLFLCSSGQPPKCTCGHLHGWLPSRFISFVRRTRPT